MDFFICIQLPKDQAANLTSDDEAVMKKQLEVAANKHRSARNSRSFSPGIRRKGSLSPEKSISKSLNNSASDRKKRGRTAKNTSGKKSFSRILTGQSIYIKLRILAFKETF